MLRKFTHFRFFFFVVIDCLELSKVDKNNFSFYFSNTNSLISFFEENVCAGNFKKEIC